MQLPGYMNHFNFSTSRLVLVFLIAFWISGSAPAQSWTQVTIPSNSWTSVTSSDDGTRLAVIAGGSLRGFIYTSTNAGRAWISNNAPYTYWNSVASSRDGKKLVAGTGFTLTSGSVFTNSGTDWAATSIGPGIWSHVATSADGNRIYAAGTVSGLIAAIYASTNSGATWTPLPAPNHGWSSIICSADGSNVFALAVAGLWRSTNAGSTWAQLTGAPPMHTLCGSTNGAILAGGSFDGSPIYYSTNFGATWNTNNSCFGLWMEFRCSDDGATIAAVAGRSGIYTSQDAGGLWTLSVPAISATVAICADGTRSLAALSYGPVYLGRRLPSLAISGSNDSLAFSWPMTSAAAGLSLEGNESLGATAWHSVTNPVTMTNGQCAVIIPKPQAKSFYRLNGY